MIDTEVESAMRSSGRGEGWGAGGGKKLSKGRRGRGDEERGGKKKTKKTKNALRAAHNFFFLKEEKFRVRGLHSRRWGRPSLGPRVKEGEGRAPLCQPWSAAL